jgi:hypothetical protein
MFSVSLNPPVGKNMPTEAFSDTADRVEKEVGLEGQPRVIVLHEKNGRRHAHCVWSRIKADELKAINLPFYKTRLTEVAMELYLEHGWDLPAGLVNRQNRNPLNFTLQEWRIFRSRPRSTNNAPRASSTGSPKSSAWGPCFPNMRAARLCLNKNRWGRDAGLASFLDSYGYFPYG